MFKHTQKLSGIMLAEVVPPAEQMEMQRMLTSFGTFSFMAGPAIAGNMLELHHGYQHVCYIITILFLINFGLYND
jgi:MFS-type transporter involved in bile tolerance (Atg22 family)